MDQSQFTSTLENLERQALQDGMSKSDMLDTYEERIMLLQEEIDAED